MTNLQVNIRSANVEDALQITQILYQLVENKEVESMTIKKIRKGQNSIDFNSLSALVQNIDYNTLIQQGSKWMSDHAIETYAGLKVLDKIVSTVKNSIDLSEKFKNKKSFLGLHCKLGKLNVIKFGRIYGIPYFDTLVTSATPRTIEDTLLEKNQWGEIPIAREKYLLIKHVALFVKTPVRAITWIGKVKEIEYNPTNKKSTIYLDGKPEQIRPIPYDRKCPRHNGHGTVYTTLERIRNAKTLCDVYPSLNQ